MSFKERLKSARERLGWTQQTLAYKSGVSERTIASYESGMGSTKSSIVSKLATALGVNENSLYFDATLGDGSFPPNVESCEAIEAWKNRATIAEEKLQILRDKLLQALAESAVQYPNKKE